MGFQKSPKLPAGESREFETNWVCTAAAAEVVSLYTTAVGLEKWFAKVLKFDSRRGGKLKFESPADSFGGTFTHFELPKLVQMVTDRFGLLSFEFDPLTSTLRFQQVIHTQQPRTELESQFQLLAAKLQAVTQ